MRSRSLNKYRHRLLAKGPAPHSQPTCVKGGVRYDYLQSAFMFHKVAGFRRSG
jgi:hypothetical protein